MSSILPGPDYLALPREPEAWIVRPLLPKGGSMLLYGDPKVGKSYLALQLAIAISTGSSWLGFEIPTPGPVVYIQLDTPRSLWCLRLEELAKSGAAVQTVYFGDRETLDTWPFDILNPDHSARLQEAVKKLNPIAVVFDTIREAHGSDENDSTAMRNIVAQLTAAVQPSALILVAHPKKVDPERGRDINNDNRGSNYVVGKMDANLSLRPRSLHLNGRAIESGSIKLQRLDNGFWEVEEDEADAILKEILADTTLPSQRAKARSLAERAGIKEGAARMRVRRAWNTREGGT